MNEYKVRIKSATLGDREFIIIAESLHAATVEAEKQVVNGRLDYVRFDKEHVKEPVKPQKPQETAVELDNREMDTSKTKKRGRRRKAK